jgi:hypothetical protein
MVSHTYFIFSVENRLRNELQNGSSVVSRLTFSNGVPLHRARTRAHVCVCACVCVCVSDCSGIKTKLIEFDAMICDYNINKKG